MCLLAAQNTPSNIKLRSGGLMLTRPIGAWRLFSTARNVVTDEIPERASARRIAVLGSGLAGLSTAYHLLQNSTPRSPVHVTIFDSEGVGGGASGVAAGLLHPFTPTGRLLWHGREAVAEALVLADAAATAAAATATNGVALEPFVRRTGVLRPAPSAKHAADFERASQSGDGAKALSAERAAALLPGLRCAGGSALNIEEGVVLQARPYLTALFAAAEAAAAMRGGSLRLERHRVPSIAWLLSRGRGGREEAGGGGGGGVSSGALGGSGGADGADGGGDGGYSAVVVAAGAAALTLPELASLPLGTCGGTVLHLVPTESSLPLHPLPPAWYRARQEVRYPAGAPGLLGQPYVSPRPDGSGVAVGATKEWGAPATSAFQAGALADGAAAAAAAERALLPAARALLPPLVRWRVERAEWGVRAMPPRTHLGAMPLIGRLPPGSASSGGGGGGGGGGGSEEPTEGGADGDDLGDQGRRSAPPHGERREGGATPVWVFAGLGARGLVYHALCGKALAMAVLSRDEQQLPEELREVWRRALSGELTAPKGPLKGREAGAASGSGSAAARREEE